jgi:trehalose 6-phosphate phosphatase
VNGGSAAAGDVDEDRLAALIEPLREGPARSAVLTDIDGTIAPIVREASEAGVPDHTRDLLRELAGRYALVGCLSGRRAEDARRVVGLNELFYSGNHGFELLMPGDSEVRPDPSLDGHDEDARRFVDALDRSELDQAGIRIEDKGPIIGLHWRGAPSEDAAESLAHEIASKAEWQGLVSHQGKKILEIRPNVPINKGIAVAALIAARPVHNAFYGGDDRTDVDAFTGLRTLRDDGRLEHAVCVAVGSDESPPEVAEAADLTVPGPEGFVHVLEALAV